MIATLQNAFPTTPLVGLGSMRGDTEPPVELADVTTRCAAADDAGATGIDIGASFGGRPDLMQADAARPAPEGELLLVEAVGDVLVAALRP